MTISDVDNLQNRNKDNFFHFFENKLSGIPSAFISAYPQGKINKYFPFESPQMNMKIALMIHKIVQRSKRPIKVKSSAGLSPKHLGCRRAAGNPHVPRSREH